MTAPLVPPDVDLRDFAFMPLEVARLQQSSTIRKTTGDEFRCAILLWCASWHQIPAASLPNDEQDLAAYAGFGVAVDAWRKVKKGAMRGWVLCDDGRWYHPVVAEKALESWHGKVVHKWRKECDRLRKENLQRQKDGAIPLELPPKPAEIKLLSAGNYQKPSCHSAGIPLEKSLKGEGEVRDRDRDRETLGSVPKDGNGRQAPLSAGIPAETPHGSNGKSPPDPGYRDPDADLYRRGKEVLGPKAGGQITKLKNLFGGNIAKTRAILETASLKADPAEYVAGIIRAPPAGALAPALPYDKGI